MYARTLGYGIVIDDESRYGEKKLPKRNQFLMQLCNLRYSGLYKANVKIEHAVSVLIHTLVCILIWLAFGCNQLSFFTAILFSVHPTTTQITCWLNGKRYGLSAVFVLGMWIALPLGLVLYPFAIWWHITALPAILLAVWEGHWKLLLWAIIPLWMSVKPLQYKFRTRFSRMPEGEIRRLRWRKLVLFVKSFSYYLTHSLLPVKMSFYHQYMETFGFSDADNAECYAYDTEFWSGLGVVCAYVASVVVTWGTPWSFGLLWWGGFGVMWFQFPISITQAFSERAIYTANIGLCYSLASLLTHFGHVPYFMYLTYCAHTTYEYMPAYRDINEFYRYALHAFPGHHRASAHVAKRYLKSHQFAHAMVTASRALAHRKHDCMNNILMAQSLLALGLVDHVFKFLNIAAENLIPGQEGPLTATIKALEQAANKVMEGRVVEK